ncbi:MAG: MFS transporter [Chloroflexi bacterium]|nr:MFS transporter [Chloroflexota bacterium]
MKINNKYKWVILTIFFAFMLLHQTDKLLINPLAPQIYEEWNLTDTQWGAISTAALIVGAVFYPVWGYLYDRYARSKLLALASFIWGATTWISAIAPSYGLFLASRASTGVDDSSYPGLYSLIADYFEPKVRGKVYGLLQLTQPLGYMAGLVLATTIAVSSGWRNIFLVTGGLGVVLAAIIFFFVKDVPRGTAEPEFQTIEEVGNFKFEWVKVKDIVRKRSLIMMNLQGFFGVFPWNTITAFIFIYLAEERGYAEGEILLTMAPAILVLASGYFIGGALGDFFFKRSPKGRVYIALFGVLVGALLLFLTLNVPIDNKALFGIMLGVTALFIPISSPNVTSTVNDVALPEIRSTAMSIQYFIESSGAALSPLLTGMIADALRRANNPFPRGTAILIICISAWLLCGIFYYITSYFITSDIDSLRNEMKRRASRV